MPAQVGEKRRFGDHISEWDGKGWVPVAAPAASTDPVMGAGAPPPPPEMSPEETYRAVMDPKFQAAMEAGGQRGEAEAGKIALETAPWLAAGALTAGSGILPFAARAVLSPAGQGLIAGGTTLAKTGDPIKAISAGLTAAAGEKVFGYGGKVAKFLRPAEKAKVAHAVKRSVREAVTETAAPAVTKAAAKAAAPVAPDVPVEDILSDMTKRVTSMHGLGIDPKDISKSLVKHYTATGRGAGLTAGKMRGLVDEIIKTTPKAETNLADEMASKVIGWAKGSGFSRAQMDDALRREYPVELTPAKAREVVDFILDSQKIGPKRTAAEMGVSLNQQIRDARASVGAGAGPKAPPARVSPAKLTNAIASEPGYAYHATNAERLEDIGRLGKLKTHRPNYGTDQDMWPDGSVEKRAYFSQKAEHVWQFAPEEGTPVVIRTKLGPQIRRESTGDLFSREPISAKELEYLGTDGAWHPVKAGAK